MSSDGSDCYDVEMEGEADKAGVPVVELSDDSDSATPAAATKVSNGVKGKTQGKSRLHFFLKKHKMMV